MEPAPGLDKNTCFGSVPESEQKQGRKTALRKLLRDESAGSGQNSERAEKFKGTVGSHYLGYE